MVIGDVTLEGTPAECVEFLQRGNVTVSRVLSPEAWAAKREEAASAIQRDFDRADAGKQAELGRGMRLGRIQRGDK